MPTATNEILLFLRAPALVQLRIEFDGGDPLDEGELAPALKEFVKKSKCEATLQSFYLKGTSFVVKELADILSNVPFITKLTLDIVDPFPESSDIWMFFPMLLRGSGSKSGLPFLLRLEMLQLLRVRPNFPLNTVFRFLEDREVLNSMTERSDTLRILEWPYRTLYSPPLPRALDEGKDAERLRRSGVSVRFGKSL